MTVYKIINLNIYYNTKIRFFSLPLAQRRRVSIAEDAIRHGSVRDPEELAVKFHKRDILKNFF